MKSWIIIAIVIGIIALAGIAVATVSNLSQETPAQNTEVCPNCGKNCNSQNGCGNEACGMKKAGKCNCLKSS